MAGETAATSGKPAENPETNGKHKAEGTLLLCSLSRVLGAARARGKTPIGSQASRLELLRPRSACTWRNKKRPHQEQVSNVPDSFTVSCHDIRPWHSSLSHKQET